MDIHERIARDFVYSRASEEHTLLCEEIWRQTQMLALFLVNYTPASREQSLAFTHLEDAASDACLAVLRNSE